MPSRRLRSLRRAFRSAYARAGELQAERFVDEISLIADDGRNDFMERVRQNGETFVDANREHLERSKIRISTHQWIIAMPSLRQVCIRPRNLRPSMWILRPLLPAEWDRRAKS